MLLAWVRASKLGQQLNYCQWDFSLTPLRPPIDLGRS